MGSVPARFWSRLGLGAVDEAEGRFASSLAHYQAARQAAEQLGSKSWVEETAAAAEKVRLRLGMAPGGG